MGVLTCFKAMEIEECSANSVTYRTSIAFQIIGAIFLFFGAAILITLVFPGSIVSSMFGLSIICLFAAMAFVLIGFAMLTYHKTVSVDKTNKKIEITDSSILGFHKSNIHFSEISGLEISKDSETFLGDESSLFVVRIYVSKLNIHGIRQFSKVEKLFETANEIEARQVADYFAKLQNVNVENSYTRKSRLIFMN